MAQQSSTTGSRTPTYQLSAMDAAVFKMFDQRPARSMLGPQHHTRVASLIQELRAVGQSTLIERMGAMLLLCSFVEGRIRAAYRDRHAIMHGVDFRSAGSEKKEFAAASQANKLVRGTEVDINPLYAQLVVLRRYHDIDQTLFNELERFVKIRNAIAHDAMYRPNAFDYPLIEAVNSLVKVTRNMRVRIKRNTEQERTSHTSDNHRSAYFKGLSIGHALDRNTLFDAVKGSTSLVAPLSHAQPLYVVAQSTALQLKIEQNEWEMHELWDKLIASQTHVPVFQKMSDGLRVRYCGYGYVASVNRAVSSAVYVDIALLSDG
jgi:hypothetical protein